MRRNLFEQLQPFPAHAVFGIREAGRIAARSRQALGKAAADGVGDPREHDRHGACRPQHILGRAADDEDDVGRERGQFRRMLTHALVIACAISILDRYVVSDLPTQLLQRLLERGVASHHFRIVRGQRCERRDAPYAR